MLQEIKYRLFELFLTQKKKLALFACLVFVGLFVVSQTTHAFALDLANVQLDALDFIDNTVLKWLVFIALLAIESVTLLNISAGLLDWSSRLPVTLSDNPLVDAGWHFTSGLANIAFILIFVIIALAYVFKLETFGMKKALPRLIIIALLINFSLLFVKMLSDLGWIFQNSFTSVFFKEGGGFATAAASALTASTKSLLSVIIGVPVAYMAVAWIPYVNVIALTAIGALVLATGGGALLGIISQTIMVIVFNFIVGSIFLGLAALFLIRIAAIWLLAIFAPLALMAFILPNTQKYFNQWMKALFQWVFLGVVVYFLVGLGLMLFGLVAPGGGQEIQFSGELGNWKFFDTFYKYLFLIIYLVVALGACKKFVPAGTEAIWSAVGKGGKTMVGAAGIAGFKGLIGTTGRISGMNKAVKEYKMARSYDQGVMGSLRAGARGLTSEWGRRKSVTRTQGVKGVVKATWKELNAAAKGTSRAIQSIAIAGAIGSGLMKPPKKRGARKKPCDACGFGSRPNELIGANADKCPHCGQVF